MSKAAHTPTPWEIDGFNVTALIHNEGSEIWPQWKHVCNFNYGYADPAAHFEGNKANAEFSAMAVNHHQELVTRLYNIINEAKTVMIDLEQFVSTDDVPTSGLNLRINEGEETLKKVMP